MLTAVNGASSGSPEPMMLPPLSQETTPKRGLETVTSEIAVSDRPPSLHADSRLGTSSDARPRRRRTGSWSKTDAARPKLTLAETTKALRNPSLHLITAAGDLSLPETENG